MRFADEKPQFDYIVFHGIFSWVPRPTQDAMLQIVRQTLKPGGVVYASYNCHPGWSPKAPSRHVLKLFSEYSSGGTIEKVHNMLGFFESFLQSQPSYMTSTPVSQRVLADVKKYVDNRKENYVAHEYFAGTWELFWFSDVAARMQDMGKCSYACSAKIIEHYEDLNVSPEGLAFLKSIKNRIFREQLKDFYVNRQFRTDIYQKGHAKLNPFEIMQKLLNTEFVLLKPLSEFKNKIGTPRGQAELARDIYDKVLDMLAQRSFAPKMMREIQQGTGIAFPQLLNALSLLVSQGMCLPCQKYSNKVKKQVDAYNRNLFEQQTLKNGSVFVASPLTGSGVMISDTVQLMIKAHMENRKSKDELARYVWDIYKPQGRKHVKDGKVLNEDSENIAEIERMAQEFLQRLPIYKQLGIC
ncbi:MAG: class I SAM-dependent methyltransferase [Helicobacter sp.]|nr:class I SAM-dependent methyltransferase [Helicobacter sp.]